MDWSLRELEFLAQAGCSLCRGEGRIQDHQGRLRPCRCALRGIFRACYSRFKNLVASERSLSRVTLDRAPRVGRRRVWGRKREEYIADFQLIARRTLDPWHARLFRYHHLLGADVALCARRLRVSRAAVYRALYHIEALLGLAFFTTEPYALYPIDDYFHRRNTQPVEACRPPLRTGPPRPATLLQALREKHNKVA